MVHAEVYIILNVAVCACVLPLGGKLGGIPAPGKRRLLMAALLSGAFAMLPLAADWLGVIALMGLPASVGLCFHKHGAQAVFRCTVTTLCAGMLLGGAVYCFLAGGMGIWQAIILSMLLSLLLYMLVTLLPTAICEVRQVELRVGTQCILLPAMLDSGNLLTDPITGLPVLVVPLRAARTLFPYVQDISDIKCLPLGFRLLSVRTAAGSALLPMFRPDECKLYLDGKTCVAELLVAVTGAEYRGVQALVPMAALPKQPLAQ